MTVNVINFDADTFFRTLELLGLPIVVAMVKTAERRMRRDTNNAHAKIRALERETGKTAVTEPNDYRKGSL